MNAKNIVIALTTAIAALSTTDTPDEVNRSIKNLRQQLYSSCLAIWIRRTRSDSIHLSAPAHVYREMHVPLNAVRAGLKKHGIDPDAFGLTECFVLQSAIAAVTIQARARVEGRNPKYAIGPAQTDLYDLLVWLELIGITYEAPEIKEIKVLQVRLNEIEILLGQDLLLRKLYELEPDIREKARTNDWVYRGHMYNWQTPAGSGWEGVPLKFTDGAWLTPSGVSFTTVAEYLVGWHCHYAACYRVFRDFGIADPYGDPTSEKKAGKAVTQQFVELVEESLSLRRLAEQDKLTIASERRLIGVVAFIRRNKVQLVAALSALPVVDRQVLMGDQSVYSFRKKVDAASGHYKTLAEKAAETGLELWRQVAKVECLHRYGHDSVVLSNDYNPDYHFYAGENQTEWVIYPDDVGDPGVSSVKPGEYCLCHHLMLDGLYIARTYTTSARGA
jgi:hypothetical protein